jgi:hypothetical protein
MPEVLPKVQDGPFRGGTRRMGVLLGLRDAHDDLRAQAGYRAFTRSRQDTWVSRKVAPACALFLKQQVEKNCKEQGQKHRGIPLS